MVEGVFLQCVEWSVLFQESDDNLSNMDEPGVNLNPALAMKEFDIL